MKSAELTRRVLIIVGLGLIALSAILLVARASQVLAGDLIAVAGHSGLREIGTVGVAGCLIAAVGSWND